MRLFLWRSVVAPLHRCVIRNEWSCKWITVKNMSLLTECAAAVLSFRYPSAYVKIEARMRCSISVSISIYIARHLLQSHWDKEPKIRQLSILHMLPHAYVGMNTSLKWYTLLNIPILFKGQMQSRFWGHDPLVSRQKRGTNGLREQFWSQAFEVDDRTTNSRAKAPAAKR